MNGTSPSERVVRAVSRATGHDPLELPPLFESIDPDALDASIGAMADGEISFRFAGHDVTVDSDGTVDLSEQASGEPAADSAASGD